MSDAPSQHTKFLFVSNGHGEDEIAARVALGLLRQRPDLDVAAFPLVGEGEPYARAGIRLLGPRRDLPSGGLLLHSLPLLLADLRAGFLGLTGAQLRFLYGRNYDVVVVVGDIYAQTLASLVRSRLRFVIQTLVSAYHSPGATASPPNRVFMERITLPERLLMRFRARAVYVRDAATEDALRAAGVESARFLGNPIADELQAEPLLAVGSERRLIALLPGSRGYRKRSLVKMLASLELMNQASPRGQALALVAWVGSELEPPPGWEMSVPEVSEPGLVAKLSRGGSVALVYEGRFAHVLNASRVVIGTAGTGNEQAVAVGKPVVAFPVPPHYSSAFLENQKRLLGPALEVVDANEESIATAAAKWLDDPARAHLAGQQGRARLGGPGGSDAIAADLLRNCDEMGLLDRGHTEA